MKGSPGAILALAIGAIFLSLGWNGRYAAVWEAIRTGESAKLTGVWNGQTGAVIDAGSPDSGDTKVIKDPVYVVKVDEPGKQYAVDAPDLIKAKNDTCSVQMVAVKIVNYPNGTLTDAMKQQTWCVDPNKMSSQIGGGQVVTDRNANYNVLPNGVMAVLTQPNAIGYFDAE